ncbi:hypothetical protein M758_8G056000 [Ceratodon purpureus]|nr:hypothetical protein M758_8G056000 [Ceratodon purpureus]
MATTRWRMAMALAFLVVANAQSDYNCSTSIKKLMPVNAEDPCANSTAYSQLGSCADFIDGNVSTPSAACCASTQSVWSKQPACFCKVTFFSIFSDPGPTRALARPPLCNITDDLCSICPSYTSALRSETIGGHSRKLNTASVVTVSVIVTLAIVGCVLLVYCIRKRALAKRNQSAQNKNFVPQFNNM